MFGPAVAPATALAAAGLMALAGAAGAAAGKQHKVTFTAAGTHTFKVPAGVTHITVTAIGAAGGNCAPDTTVPAPANAIGGQGASVSATLPVKPGAKLYVGVGGVGGACAPNFSSSGTVSGGAGGVGGGAAGGSGDAGGVSGGGGGGASDVALKSSGKDALLVAAGGGGASYCAGTGGNAGSAGVSGTACNPGSAAGTGGGAGTRTAGGAGGTGGSATITPPTGPPTTYTGANGAQGNARAGGAGGVGAPNGPSASGGGGGGGLYGGGGGGGGSFESGGGGGGGGSSFVAKHASHVSAPTPSSATATVTISYTITGPKATTRRASGVSSSTATLHGSVNAEGKKTTYYFQYGTTTRYGKSTAKGSLAAGKSSRSVSATVTGLKAGRTYHFRVVARNSAGTAYGKDMTFRTVKRATGPVFTG